MFRNIACLFSLLFITVSCDQQTKIAPKPKPSLTVLPQPTPVVKEIVAQTTKIKTEAPELSKAGLTLIYEYETGGQRQYERNPHPELPDLRLSGVTAGIGFDMHQYSKSVILHDWSEVLSKPAPERLAETQPYYGKTAVEPLRRVRDITISWSGATHVFLSNDVAREFSAAKRAFPGFGGLSANCQSALIANGFARGYSTVGANRTELREIKSLIPQRDYRGIATQLRKQERVWRGTSIYNGLRNRVNAEAKLAETPDA